MEIRPPVKLPPIDVTVPVPVVIVHVDPSVQAVPLTVVDELARFATGTVTPEASVPVARLLGR